MQTKLTRTEESLMVAMLGMDIIDCHEHLPPEPERTSVPQDVFTLFSHYTRFDLFSAGMDRNIYRGHLSFADSRPVYESLFDQAVPLEQRWAVFEPYWEAIRHGSYARAALLTARMVYGVDDINAQTFRVLSERIAAENTPGLYRRILCDRCRIRVALTQCGTTAVERPLVPLMPSQTLTETSTRERVQNLARDYGGKEIRTLDDYLELAGRVLETWIAAGAVGIKTVSMDYPLCPKTRAEKAFTRLIADGKVAGEDARTLNAFLTHAVFDLAAELNLVVAVHAGIWRDFRELDAKFMLQTAPAHPRTNFDLYHLGMPSVRDTIVIAKNLPNVFLNLAWTHIISPVQTRSGIDELLDQVPVNKVLAFGGDYQRPVEKIVGHLHMARQNLAHVLGARIDHGLMSPEEAKRVLRLWFWDNPLRLYARLTPEEEGLQV